MSNPKVSIIIPHWNGIEILSECLDSLTQTEYSDKEIYEVLKTSGLKYYKSNNIEKEVARCLADGKVVARFNGRMEYGPRALGNRSMLYQTTDPSANKWLNKKLKRTEFMPFAPMTLIDDVDKYYLNINGGMIPAKYMTMTFDCTQRMIDEAPATVHVDKTARPQFITKDDYPDMYEVLSEYKKITELSNIINTSFNMHEEPIVSTELDAVDSFIKSGIKWMALGNYLVQNNY